MFCLLRGGCSWTPHQVCGSSPVRVDRCMPRFRHFLAASTDHLVRVRTSMTRPNFGLEAASSGCRNRRGLKPLHIEPNTLQVWSQPPCIWPRDGPESVEDTPSSAEITQLRSKPPYARKLVGATLICSESAQLGSKRPAWLVANTRKVIEARSTLAETRPDGADQSLEQAREPDRNGSKIGTIRNTICRVFRRRLRGSPWEPLLEPIGQNPNSEIVKGEATSGHHNHKRARFIQTLMTDGVASLNGGCR